MSSNVIQEKDIVDKVNRHWTFFLLLGLALVALTLPLIVPTASCFTSAHFIRTQADFGIQQCTYRAYPFEVGQKGKGSEDDDNTKGSLDGQGVKTGESFTAISWAPCMFALMAFAIKLPFVFWSQLQGWCGVNIEAIVESVRQQQKKRQDERSEFIKDIVQTLAMLLKPGDNSITFLLMFARKGLTTITSIVLFLTVEISVNPLSYIGESNRSLHGKGALRSYDNCSLVKGSLDKLGIAPCIYPANIMLQKLFIFVSIYTIFLVFINVFDLIIWATMLFIPEMREKKLATYIYSREGSRANTASHCLLDRKFASFLGFDGFLLLKIINQNLGETAWAEFSILLWRKYQDIRENEFLEAERGVATFADQDDSIDVFKEKDYKAPSVTSDNMEMSISMVTSQKSTEDGGFEEVQKQTEKL